MDSGELATLYESFAIDCFGDKEYSIIQYIKNRLEETKELENYIKQNIGNNLDINKYIEMKFSENRRNICNKIYYVIAQELQYAKENNIEPMFHPVSIRNHQT